MNHHTYSNLLFRDAEDLSAEQDLALRKHLETCEQCQALSNAMENLEAAISKSVMVEPEAGFVTRWQSHLEAERLQIHKRQTIRTLIFVGVGLVFLAAAILFISSPWLRTPDQIFWTGIYQYFSMVTYVSSLRSTLVAMFRSTSLIPPLFVAILGFGLVSELVVLWVVFYRLISNFRRITV